MEKPHASLLAAFRRHLGLIYDQVGVQAPYIADTLERFLGTMPESADPELQILKAHLLAEEGLIQYLETHLTRPQAMPADVRFSQRLWLAKAITPVEDSKDWIWDALNVLNKLRNELAHKVDAVNRKMLMSTLKGLVKKSRLWSDPSPSTTPAQADASVFCVVCLELSLRVGDQGSSKRTRRRARLFHRRERNHLIRRCKTESSRYS